MYYDTCISSCYPISSCLGLLLTLALISIHSSFSWRPFPTRIFILIRLTSLNTFGYTWTGNLQTSWDYAKTEYSRIRTFAFRKFERNQTIGTFFGVQEHGCWSLRLVTYSLMYKGLWRGGNVTHVNACSDLYEDLFARSPIFIVRLAIFQELPLVT